MFLGSRIVCVKLDFLQQREARRGTAQHYYCCCCMSCCCLGRNLGVDSTVKNRGGGACLAGQAFGNKFRSLRRQVDEWGLEMLVSSLFRVDLHSSLVITWYVGSPVLSRLGVIVECNCCTPTDPHNSLAVLLCGSELDHLTWPGWCTLGVLTHTRIVGGS